MTEKNETLEEQTAADTLIYKFAGLAAALVETGKQRGACGENTTQEERAAPEMIYDASLDDEESARLFALPHGMFQAVFETPDFCVGMEVLYDFKRSDAFRVHLAHFSGKIDSALDWAFKTQDVFDDMLVNNGLEEENEQ